MKVQEKSNPGSAWIRRVVGTLITVIVPMCILILAVVIVMILLNTRREAEQKELPRQARLVEVTVAKRTDIQTVVHAMGTVVPARKVSLSPEVSGQVVFISPAASPGGMTNTGDVLVEIDPRDYEFAIQQCRQSVAQAQLNLRIEQGRQAVAQAEYKLIGEQVSEQDRELVLRQPQLEYAEVALTAARAALAQAELERQRCRIVAPFNAVIQEKFVEQGATASPDTRLMTLIGIDEYWVEGMIRVSDLEFIKVPSDSGGDGSLVRVFDRSQWGDHVHRSGQVIRLLPDLQTNGRMARILVSVMDPLSSSTTSFPRLLIGSYVHLEITGKPLASVIPVARKHLRNGDTIWIMNQEDQLEIRPVEILYRDKFMVYVGTGLEAEQRIVITDIATPVEGMSLRLEALLNADTPHAASLETSHHE